LTAAFLDTPQDTLNATKPVDDLAWVRSELVYERMAEMSPSYKIEPILYTSATHNAAGTQWTFTLNPRAKFANGEEVEGSDVLATLAADQGQDSTQTLTMIDLKKSTASGKTIHFVLSAPTADLPFDFAMSPFVVLPHGKGSTNPATMNGSGPYKVVQFVPGERSVLERRSDYWDGDKRGMAKKIVLIGVADPSARMRALLSHQVDLAGNVNLSDAATDADKSSVALHKSVSPESMDLILNAKIAPFNNVKVRQAFRLAVNRTQLASVALSGIGKPGNDVWGAGFPGYDKSLPQRAQNIAQAKKLLAEAGRSHVSFTVYAPADGGPLTEGTLLIAQQVKAAGFDMTVKQLSEAQYDGEAQEWTSWQGVAFSLGYPFETTAPFFYEPGAPYYFGIGSSAFASTFNEALATFSAAKKQQLLDSLQKQLWETGSDVLWGLAPIVIASNPDVVGLNQIADYNYPDLTNVYVK